MWWCHVPLRPRLGHWWRHTGRAMIGSLQSTLQRRVRDKLDDAYLRHEKSICPGLLVVVRPLMTHTGAINHKSTNPERDLTILDSFAVR